MAQPSFVIPAGETSPEALERKRKMAELLLAQAGDTSPIGHWSQGVARMAQALMGGINMGQANSQEQAGRQQAQQQFMEAIQGGGQNQEAIMGAMGNQFQNPGQQRILELLLSDQLKRRQPDWKMFEGAGGDQMRFNQNDPNSKPELFYDAPDVPKPPISGEQTWIDPNTFKPLYTPPEKPKPPISGEHTLLDPNTYKPVYTPPPELPKPTDDMRELEAMNQQRQAAGMPPMRLDEWLLSKGKSGASNVTVGGVTGGKFDENLGKGVADVYVKQMEQGQLATATKAASQQLRVLMKGKGGALDGFAAAVAPYLPEGMLPEGANDVVAAQAIVSGLIPKQRVPGSGTTSDFDARKYMESLPSIWNKPGANEIILNTTEAYADYQIAISNIIADVASDPSVENKAKAIREKISTLPDPFVTWKQYMATSGLSGSDSSPTLDDIENEIRRRGLAR